jgi:ZIP family zinc transporter
MNEITTILLFSWLAGITAFLGGVISHYEQTIESKNKDEFVHGVMAFGGGILVAAVAFSLAPEAMNTLSPILLCITFLGGGMTFGLIDRYLSSKGGSKAQFLAMIMDFVPEALAMGALFSKDKKAATLLAVFIAAQNFPEGFNSFREITSDKVTPKKTLIILLIISLLGPVAAILGYYLLVEVHYITASIMSFAAGGILYLVFQDIAPKSSLKTHFTPSIGAVIGFLLGMIGQQILG